MNGHCNILSEEYYAAFTLNIINSSIRRTASGQLTLCAGFAHRLRAMAMAPGDVMKNAQVTELLVFKRKNVLDSILSDDVSMLQTGFRRYYEWSRPYH